MAGSAAPVAYVGDRCVMAYSDHKHTAVVVRGYKGNGGGADSWTADAAIPHSATVDDPVLVGGDEGLVFVRRFDGWAVSRVTPGATKDDSPGASIAVHIDGLPDAALSAVRVGGRVLLVSRHDSDLLEYRWLTMGEKPVVSGAKALKLTSMVPVGVTEEADGKLTVVSAARHPEKGPFCMQVTALIVSGDEISEGEPEWTHGHGHNHCTSRPVPVWHKSGSDASPQLVIFHTGWTDGNSCWTAWRTTRIGNKALDDGWLTSQLYDEWTRSRVACGFADGAQGTVYTFRWDPGDHHDWKVNTLFAAYNGYGIDDQPMRDFDDGAKISLWGIRQSILNLRRVSEDAAPVKGGSAAPAKKE